jgi:type II secretion system protein H
MRVGSPSHYDLAERRVRTDTPYRAFTLVELMVVMVIIGIIASVMVLEMGGSYEDALLRSNARKLIDLCDAASNRAIATHQAQTLKIDATSGKFLVRAKVTEAEGEDQIIEGELDKRITLMIREPERGEETEETEEPVKRDTIVFYPDGTADAREFLLRDRAGVELLLRMNPTTSRVRIIEMAAQ